MKITETKLSYLLQSLPPRMNGGDTIHTRDSLCAGNSDTEQLPAVKKVGPSKNHQRLIEDIYQALGLGGILKVF